MSEVRISPIVMNEAKVVSSDESLSLYGSMVSLMKEILRRNQNYIDIKGITTQTEKIVSQLSLSNEELLMLASIKDPGNGNHLPCHSTNVCILSIEVGLGLGYTRPQLIELGISALLHDVGMTEYLHLSKQPRELTAEEYNEVKKHPIKGIEILKRTEDLNKTALSVVLQHHERLDGSGYPKGLKGESIDEYARIVGLVDVYEAMIHRRLYRDRFLPLEAMREILTEKKSFEHTLIKILIEKTGILPIGSLVVLNTKEIAEVVSLNYAASLRPAGKVRILCEADGKEPTETKVLDLTAHSSIYIKKPVLRKKTN